MANPEAKEFNTPDLENCPFCKCAVFLAVDAESPDYEFGDCGYETADIWGEHGSDCPLDGLEIQYNLSKFKSLDDVAKLWNTSAPLSTPCAEVVENLQWARNCLNAALFGKFGKDEQIRQFLDKALALLEKNRVGG